MEQRKRSKLRDLLQRLKDEIVQDVPPELEACEICRKTECYDDEWITCENRMAHAKCLEVILLTENADE